MKTTKEMHRAGADVRDRVARRIVSRMDESTQNLPHEITERLKTARMQAVSKRKVATVPTSASAVVGSAGQASLQMGDGFHGLWMKLGAWIPLLALVTGLVVIGTLQDEWAAREIAEVDTEILTDQLPPSAYTDPGFAQFVRNIQEK